MNKKALVQNKIFLVHLCIKATCFPSGFVDFINTKKIKYEVLIMFDWQKPQKRYRLNMNITSSNSFQKVGKICSNLQACLAILCLPCFCKQSSGKIFERLKSSVVDPGKIQSKTESRQTSGQVSSTHCRDCQVQSWKPKWQGVSGYPNVLDFL